MRALLKSLRPRGARRGPRQAGLPSPFNQGKRRVGGNEWFVEPNIDTTGHDMLGIRHQGWYA